MKCNKCGHVHKGKDSWRMRCVSCGAVNLEKSIASHQMHTLADVGKNREVRRLKSGDWDICWGEHWKTKEKGIADKSQTILGGEPGAGKSTLLLEIQDGLIEFSGIDVTYILTEEPEDQVKERADRLGIKNQDRIAIFDLVTHPDLDLQPIINRKAAIFLDSIQGLAGKDLNQQVELAKSIKTLSARHGLPSFLVSQINKAGDTAGLMELQHACDTLISFFTVDDKKQTRELTVLKNRNGKTMSCYFNMTETGLILMKDFSPGKIIEETEPGWESETD